jgi:hypothetical protein
MSLRALVLDVDSSMDENLNIKVKDLDIEIAKRISGIQQVEEVNQKATDIKQVGVMLKMMLTGDHRDRGITDASISAQEFIKKLLENDSNKRIKAMPALNDKWLL